MLSFWRLVILAFEKSQFELVSCNLSLTLLHVSWFVDLYSSEPTASETQKNSNKWHPPTFLSQPLHGFYFFRFCKSSWWWFQPTNSWSQLSWHRFTSARCQCYPVHHLSGTTYSFIDISIVSDHVANANPVTSANDPRCWKQFYSSICCIGRVSMTKHQML